MIGLKRATFRYIRLYKDVFTEDFWMKDFFSQVGGILLFPVSNVEKW